MNTWEDFLLVLNSFLMIGLIWLGVIGVFWWLIKQFRDE